MERCKWCNLKNKKYINYHDKIWGKPCYDDNDLFEFLVLETFQSGLSWEIILNKKDYFRKAFSNYNLEEISKFQEDTVNELLKNCNIIRNRQKIEAVINNAKIFIEIQKEFGSFSKYIWKFTNEQIIYEINKTKSELSDKIAKDLKKRGMKFVGSTTIYSYLQAIGIIYSHEKECFLYKEN